MGPQTKWLQLPIRAQLLVDILLIGVFVALDVRDLVYKTTWLGPDDTFSFATATKRRLERRPLAPTANATFLEEYIQRDSGWSSFLQRCDTLTPISSNDSAFAHVLARNCSVGISGNPPPTTRIPELVLASSVRVDSMAWSACRMLYHHRKPQICHSPIVRGFADRYNLDPAPEPLQKKRNVQSPNPGEDASVAPDTDAEKEVLDFLTVLSKSSPISQVVCVEGFALDGPGHYTPSIFGCASPSHYQSAFIGYHAIGFPQHHQNKAWLSSDVLHISSMTYVIRENRRSFFIVDGSVKDGNLVLEHLTQLNFSSFGVLYTVAVLIDVFLLAINIYSALEIGHLMLLPIWRSLARNTVTTNTNKLVFAAEDCQAVLTSSLYRSKPMVVLITISNVLHWMTMAPNAIILAEATASTAKWHATLSTFRLWVLVLIALNALWDVIVSWFEPWAFGFVHATYISVMEVVAISTLVAYLRRDSLLRLPSRKYAIEHQRLTDPTSFVGRVAISNAFPEHHDSLHNTGADVIAVMYVPLLVIVVWSLVGILAFLGLRYAYLQFRYPDLIKHHHNSRFLVHGGGNVTGAHRGPVVQPDLAGEGDDMEGREPTPPRRTGSPKRQAFDLHGSADASATALSPPTSGSERDLRLPLEKVVDIPIRARSLVRNEWKMEKKIGHQVFLRPPQYLEHGIILEGGCMKTRVGFLDVVHPYLRAANHAIADDDLSQLRTSSSSSPRRRGARGVEPIGSFRVRRKPLVPLR